MSMQQLIEALGGAGGIAQMAKELGVNEQMVAQGASALLPALLGGFKSQAASGGLDGLVGMLGQMGGGGLLDQVLGADPTPTAPGNDILGQILGGGKSEAVVQHAASQSGLPAGLLQSMLPMLAMAAAGFMAKQASAGPAGGEGGLGGLVGSVMSALTGGGAQAGGLGQIASLLDMDKDGNPLDDIMGMASKLTGR
jgi:hypothetical protein